MLFFNDTATTEIYTLSLHDALPIYRPYGGRSRYRRPHQSGYVHQASRDSAKSPFRRAESRDTVRSSSVALSKDGGRVDRKSTRLKLQSRQYLVCRLLLEKTKSYVRK